MEAVSWELLNITKEFPGVRALNDVCIKIKPGEIHGLIGENGSGKSTLIKCLSGVHVPDKGVIRKNGTVVSINNPIRARALGVATIYQEFSLVPSLTVAENIYLGSLPKGSKNRSVDWDKMYNDSKKILEELEVHIDPNALVEDLSVAQQQIVEISKALSRDSSIFIMDEPTTALGLAEIEKLHELVRRLTQKGHSVIYISHRLDEIVELVDKLTILKDGVIVGECSKEELKVDHIVKIMVGSEVKDHYPKKNNKTDQVLLEVKDIYTENGVNGASFTVNKGEVFGLAGLIGSRRTEIAHAIFGVDSITKGDVCIKGISLLSKNKLLKSPKSAIKKRIALVTENRKYNGLFMEFKGPENMTIAKLKKIKKFKFLNLKTEKKVGSDYIDSLKITPSAIDKKVQFLSGGNQQKVIIARWLFSDAELFIFDEPTQGIDVNAKVEVYKLIDEITAAGNSIILISSDFSELLAMSDRVGIVKNGRIVETNDTDTIDREILLQKVLTNSNTE